MRGMVSSTPAVESRRVLRKVSIAVLVAVVTVVSWYVSPSLALGAGSQLPAGCDQSLDVTYWGTCITARDRGYTASGLTAWAQASIDGEGYWTSVDGDFGPATETAVKSWQSDRGTTPDGIVGNNSWIRMDEFGSVRSWSKVGSCAQYMPNAQLLKNEGWGAGFGTFYALRACTGPIYGSGGGLLLANTHYCVEVEDNGFFYTKADHADPYDWPFADFVPTWY